MECRIYAEDPDHNFLPSPGRIQQLRAPSGPGVRDDSGAAAGLDVPIFYDPMISKLVCLGRGSPGRDRAHAAGARRVPRHRHQDDRAVLSLAVGAARVRRRTFSHDLSRRGARGACRPIVRRAGRATRRTSPRSARRCSRCCRRARPRSSGCEVRAVEAGRPAMEERAAARRRASTVRAEHRGFFPETLKVCRYERACTTRLRSRAGSGGWLVHRVGDGFAVEVDGRLWHVDAARIDAHTLSLIVGDGAPKRRHRRRRRRPSPSEAAWQPAARARRP